MSTVHICLSDILGVAVACEVIFYPGYTPFFNGAALAVSGARSIRLDAEGNGSVTLLPGRYEVRFSGITGNTDTLFIQVPNDDESYPLSALICEGNWLLPTRDFLQKSKNLGDVTDPEAAFEAIKQEATPTQAGVVSLATQAEVDEETCAAKAVTPATFADAAKWGTKESALGNPDVDGKVLASTAVGVRSWVFMAAGFTSYQLKTAAFTAVALQAYAVDTTGGAITVTLPEAPTSGQFVQFADARGTWKANPVTFIGGKFEGAAVDFTNSAQGTSLMVLYIDATTGWRILESGTKPHILTAPTITGHSVGATLHSTTGVWSGNPVTFAYQWQSSADAQTWADIEGATSATFVPTSELVDQYVRVSVTAENASGVSAPAE